jgi:hypothetical protein
VADSYRFEMYNFTVRLIVLERSAALPSRAFGVSKGIEHATVDAAQLVD